METGWVLVGETWYYMNSSEQWKQAAFVGDTGIIRMITEQMGNRLGIRRGHWYYLNTDGIMKQAGICRGYWYYLNTDEQWKQVGYGMIGTI